MNMFNPANPIGFTNPISPLNPNGIYAQQQSARVADATQAVKSSAGNDQAAALVLGLILLIIAVLVYYMVYAMLEESHSFWYSVLWPITVPVHWCLRFACWLYIKILY